jgi:hypothetical protein
VKHVEATQYETSEQAESPEVTLTLDSISNALAMKLANELENYSELMLQLEALQAKRSKALVSIKRAKAALEALQGTTFELPELEDEDPVREYTPGTEPRSVSRVEPSPAPVVPAPTVVRDTSNDCPGCGSQGTLYQTTITTSRGRKVNVYQCDHSQCNAQFPC